MNPDRSQYAALAAKPVTIRLPWPDKRLSPNARVDRFDKSRLVARYRGFGHYAVVEANARNLGWAGACATLRFCPPDKRRRDLDNMLASAKSLLDGIADATGIDDSKWELVLCRGDVVPAGQILVTLSPIPEAAV